MHMYTQHIMFLKVYYDTLSHTQTYTQSALVVDIAYLPQGSFIYSTKHNGWKFV